jgi:hypothetical protein
MQQWCFSFLKIKGLSFYFIWFFRCWFVCSFNLHHGTIERVQQGFNLHHGNIERERV